MNEDILYENITNDELKTIFARIRHTKQRMNYILKNYANIINKYVMNDYATSDGSITGKIEVYKNRVIKDEMITRIKKHGTPRRSRYLPQFKYTPAQVICQLFYIF